MHHPVNEVHQIEGFPMNTIERRLSPVNRQLEAYGEFRNRDHQEAMNCRDWEDAIAVGLSVFRMIQEREGAWRSQVFRGVVPFSDADDRDFRARFESWLDTTKEFANEILPKLKSRYSTVEGSDELLEQANIASDVIKNWAPPKLSRAIGLRETTLTPQAAKELDALIEEAAHSPPPMPKCRMEIKDPSFLNQSSPI
jgi:hypothetical protein